MGAGFADGEYDDTGDLDQDREHNQANEIADTDSNSDALKTVTDQNTIQASYEYRAVGSSSEYQTELRQCASGTPPGDRDVITTSDGLGRVVSIVTKATVDGTQTSKVTRQYKFCGALWKETQQIGDAGGDSRTVEYGFDNCGKVNKLYWPYTGSKSDYVEFSDFDGLNRWRTVANNIGGNGTDLAKYTFLGARPATKDYYDGATRIVAQTFWSSSGGGTNNYDHYARLAKSHAIGDPDDTPADVMKINYAYDDGSNPTWRYDELSNGDSRKWSQKYEYDVMDRLIKAQQGVVGDWNGSPTMTPDKTWVWDGTYDEHDYVLDKVGNWADWYNNGSGQETRGHNNVNEITDINGSETHVDYDATGNMNKMPKPTDPANHHYVCTYDFRNRLVKVETDDETPKKVAAYSYDGLNRRIRKIVYEADGETEDSDTRYLYSGWRCIEERDENDSQELRARYVYGGLYIDEPLRMYRDTTSDGDFADAGDVNVYYLQDRLFNVVALTDTDGGITERTWYECYGKPTCRQESNGHEQTPSHFGNPVLFCGYRHDPDTGLHHVRNRMYHPLLGRWLQRDPLGYVDGMSLYEYGGSRAVTLIDPIGLEPAPSMGTWAKNFFSNPWAGAITTNLVLRGNTDALSFYHRNLATTNTAAAGQTWEHLANTVQAGMAEVSNTVTLGQVEEYRAERDHYMQVSGVGGTWGETGTKLAAQTAAAAAHALALKGAATVARPAAAAAVGAARRHIDKLGRLVKKCPKALGRGMTGAQQSGHAGITVTNERLAHVAARHLHGGAETAGKSLFNAGENVSGLLRAAESVTPVAQSVGSNFQRAVNAGRAIGVDRATGQATNVYTVMTDSAGNMVTMFPGLPTR